MASLLDLSKDNQALPLMSMTDLLERCGRSPRAAAVPVLKQLAEAIMPGAQIVDELREDQVDLINLFTADLSREFTLLGQLVAAATSAQGGLVMEASKAERARITAIIAAARLEVWVKERLIPIYEHHYKRTAELTLKTLRRADIPVSLRDIIEEKIIQAGGKRVGLLDIPRDTQESLFKVIDKGRELGLNPRETAKMIEEFVPRGRFVDAGTPYRARLIARTETLHAQRMSSLELYRESPAVEKVVLFDGESDEECSARNGSVVSFDEAEAEMNDTHPNCVLCFAPYA